MYELSASIDGGTSDLEVVCAFDPTKVVARLRLAFPDAEIDPTDHAWRDYKTFLRMGLTEEQVDGRSTALGVAASDARRRGPRWRFRIPSSSGWVSGAAERHVVRFFSETPIPEPLRSDLLTFVEGLRFAPCVSIKCIRMQGNDEYPA